MSTSETMSIARPRPVSQLNRKVYLGLYDSRSWPEPDSRDEQRVRDYMVQKYENKRWYVAPTEAMKEEAKRTNEAALNSKPQVKPLRSLLGENASKLAVGTAQKKGKILIMQTPPASHAPVTVSVPLPGGFKSPPAVNNTHASSQPTSAAPRGASGFDLLGEIGGDPFASSTQASNSHNDAGGFADFSNFDNFSTSTAHPQAAAPVHLPQQAFPISNTPLQPLGIGQPSAQPPAAAAVKPPPAKPVFGGDKYAALADLDSAFSAPATTATSINWGGPDGGAINWGGTSSTASTPSHSTAGLSWSTTGAAAAGGPINWGSQGPTGLPVGTTPTSAAFGIPPTVSAANPFGGVTPGMNVFSSAAPVSTVNPFGAAATSSLPMSHFSQAGGIPTSAGFGAHFAAQPAGFGQFPPMQNGGYNMTPTSGGYGGPAAFSQQQFMAQTAGWGQMPPHQGAQAQPVANPFMNTAMQQQVPPPSGSTNPFL